VDDAITPPVPAGLDERGGRLWTSLHEAYPAMIDAERELVLEACRVADRLERLDEVCRATEPVVQAKTGPIANPAFAEARQQQNLLKQIIAALRLPDAKTGSRPQYRGPRGVQQPKGAGTGSVSSLDRARAARGA
jgi:hypothetical protein